MTAQPSAAAVARVEAEMLDNVEFRHPPTLGAYDPATGEHPYEPGDIVYSGKAAVTDTANQPRYHDRGGEREAQHRYRVAIPRDAPPPNIDDHGVVSASDDPALVGEFLIVRAVTYGSRSARRILLCDLLEVASR